MTYPLRALFYSKACVKSYQYGCQTRAVFRQSNVYLVHILVTQTYFFVRAHKRQK